MRPLSDEEDIAVIGLRIPRTLKERFQKACGERSMSKAIRLLIEAYLKKEPPQRRRTKKKVSHGHSPRD